MAEEKEVTYYSDDKGVRITNTRVIVSSTTYAMANISSVSTVKKPARRVLGILIAILGLIVLVVTAVTGSTVGIAFGAVFLCFGVLVAVLLKPIYIARIASASGEVDAISAKEEKYIQTIVMAMNEAIIKRG